AAVGAAGGVAADRPVERPGALLRRGVCVPDDRFIDLQPSVGPVRKLRRGRAEAGAAIRPGDLEIVEAVAPEIFGQAEAGADRLRGLGELRDGGLERRAAALAERRGSEEARQRRRIELRIVARVVASRAA